MSLFSLKTDGCSPLAVPNIYRKSARYKIIIYNVSSFYISHFILHVLTHSFQFLVHGGKHIILRLQTAIEKSLYAQYEINAHVSFKVYWARPWYSIYLHLTDVFSLTPSVPICNCKTSQRKVNKLWCPPL